MSLVHTLTPLSNQKVTTVSTADIALDYHNFNQHWILYQV